MTAAQEIERLRAAIARTEREWFERFPFNSATDVCCSDCKYGSDEDYRAMSRKRDRQDAWLLVLLAKQSGDVAAMLEARANYTKAVGRDRRRSQ